MKVHSIHILHSKATGRTLLCRSATLSVFQKCERSSPGTLAVHHPERSLLSVVVYYHTFKMPNAILASDFIQSGLHSRVQKFPA